MNRPSWTCRVCTFAGNNIISTVCEICGKSRMQSLSMISPVVNDVNDKNEEKYEQHNDAVNIIDNKPNNSSGCGTSRKRFRASGDSGGNTKKVKKRKLNDNNNSSDETNNNKSLEWNCSKCTFSNQHNDISCSMCDESRFSTIQKHTWNTVLSLNKNKLTEIPQWIKCNTCNQWRYIQIRISIIKTWEPPSDYICSQSNGEFKCNKPSLMPSANTHSTYEIFVLGIQRRLLQLKENITFDGINDLNNFQQKQKQICNLCGKNGAKNEYIPNYNLCDSCYEYDNKQIQELDDRKFAQQIAYGGNKRKRDDTINIYNQKPKNKKPKYDMTNDNKENINNVNNKRR